MQTQSASAHIDNRRNRSDDRLMAVGLQLEQVIGECGLEGCLLTDVYGMVLASAQCTTQALERAITITRTAQEHEGEDFVRRQFRLEGMPVFLTVVGSDADANQQAADRAVQGIQRIHATTTCEGMRADLAMLAGEGVVI